MVFFCAMPVIKKNVYKNLEKNLKELIKHTTHNVGFGFGSQQN